MDLPEPDLGSPSRLRAILDHFALIEDTRELHRVERAADGDYRPHPTEARFPAFDEAKPGVTLSDLFDHWRAETKPAASTLTTTRGIVTKFDKHVGAGRAANITAEQIVAWEDGPLGDTVRFGFGDDAAHGMFQWRGSRFRALKAYAAARGKAWTDFDSQVGFFDEESRRYGSDQWRKSTDLTTANRGMERFEGYGDDSFGTRLANAQQLMTGGAGLVPTMPASVADAAVPSAAVDNAMRLQGAGSRQAAAALGSKMTDGQWCADLVNGALHSAGVKGSGSSMAQSFPGWGVGVQPNDVRKGDVILEDHGRGKGHAGNVVAMEMVSGNFSRMVKRN